MAELRSCHELVWQWRVSFNSKGVIAVGGHVAAQCSGRNYLVPMNVWYILPFEALAGTVSLQFAPERVGHKYQLYMEAWHLLRG
jgi:hypothetical protein